MISDSDEPLDDEERLAPTPMAKEVTPGDSETVMCAQRQHEGHEGGSQGKRKEDFSEVKEVGGKKEELEDGGRQSRQSGKTGQETDEGNSNHDGASGIKPRASRALPTTGSAVEKLQGALSLPAGTSKGAAGMIAAELEKLVTMPGDGPEPAVTPRSATAVKPRHGAMGRGVTSGGNEDPSGNDMILRAGQHRTVSRVSGRARPEASAEATQRLRAELMKSPGMPVQPALYNPPARNSTDTPDSLPNLFSEQYESSGDEMEAREQAASECLRLIRTYDETAFETARGMRASPKQRVQFLAQHYTPTHRAKRGKMPWPQVAARASFGFPTDRPIFEEAFPFHKWAKWSTPTSTVTDTTLTGKAAQAARAEGFEGIDDPCSLIADAGHTPYRGNSPCGEAEPQGEASEEEHGVNTAEKAARQVKRLVDGPAVATEYALHQPATHLPGMAPML